MAGEDDPTSMLQYPRVQRHWKNAQFGPEQHMTTHSSEKLRSQKCCSPGATSQRTQPWLCGEVQKFLPHDSED